MIYFSLIYRNKDGFAIFTFTIFECILLTLLSLVCCQYQQKKKKTINVGTRNQIIKLNITYFSIPFMK